MTSTIDPNTSSPEIRPDDHAPRIYRITVAVLLLILIVEFVLVLIDGQWLTAFLVAVISGIISAPILFRNRFGVKIPAEFQVLVIIFLFASLFMGEVWGFYERVWWWDMALHAVSGLLLGMVGFLLVYVLNESERINLHLQPGFVAFFAFLFAVTGGTVWEIFEFGMDQLFGMNMQKPMLGDPSGLTDTMWDLIVDTLGALVISLFGWLYMKRKEESFIELWIHKFIRNNPQLFRG